ncbi:nitrite reductase small subunit NirD [Frankia sp. AgB1.9]|uniref:nitrite reductase small subunit NirD n=1 Tax=unclassified Frankia TaxID=2632575 RepID=UPI0019332606|nr:MULTISPECIES: nitrite reductase small subunit NirD [unclassified Frankia]MBL7488757.1 nitrite reductase small subunit NirD [Frankia sp. AgW1.1]MBL7546562.1 nitrite reductase small subunit NirD [Frankia sp. AgB1.9]MBL7625068.1 nitrite reductase small subunit NirD [Frankia sp. AgB1.8]
MTSTTTQPAALAALTGTWTPVCRAADLLTERGAAALIGELQIAVFRTFDGALYAVDNRDPFTGVHVLARGIVGSRGDVPTVASPLHKQVFDLRTGACLDDPAVTVVCYPVRDRAGLIEIWTPGP